MSSFKVFLEQARATGHPLTSEELALAARGQYTAWAERVKAERSRRAASAYFIFMLAGKNWAMANVAIQTGLVQRLVSRDKATMVYAWVDLHAEFLWLMAEDPQWESALAKALPMEWVLTLNALNMPDRDWYVGLKTVLPLVEQKGLATLPHVAAYMLR